MPNTSRFAVAVHTLLALGYYHRQGIERVPSQAIAQSVNTHPVVVRKMIRLLKKAGLVDSKEGKRGGAYLARDPSKISLKEVFSAVETESILTLNKKREIKKCPVSCRMKDILLPVFREVDTAVLRALEKKSLKDLLDQL